MALRALQELVQVAVDLEADAEVLERFSAAKRGSNEAERESMMCRVEARRIRRDVERQYAHQGGRVAS